MDGLAEIRDTWVSISYAGKVNTKKIIDDVAAQMGVTVTYSYNAEFADIPNGFSFVGQAKFALTKACAVSGLEWSIQNGILQVKKPGDVMSKEVYVLSAETGLLSIPQRVQVSSSDSDGTNEIGWDIEFLMNGAIGIGDYVQVQSKYLEGVLPHLHAGHRRGQPGRRLEVQGASFGGDRMSGRGEFAEQVKETVNNMLAQVHTCVPGKLFPSMDQRARRRCSRP